MHAYPNLAESECQKFNLSIRSCITAGSKDPTNNHHQVEKLVMVYSEGYPTDLIGWHQPNVPYTVPLEMREKTNEEIRTLFTDIVQETASA